MSPRDVFSSRRMLTAVLVAVSLGFLGSATGASAANGPGWEVTSRTYPTYLPPGGEGNVHVSVYNVGAGNSEGPVTVTDILPEGVTATEAGEYSAYGRPVNNVLWDCTGNGPDGAPGILGATVVRCTNDPVNQPVIPGGGGTPIPGSSSGEIWIAVETATKAAGVALPNRVTVSGGGAPAAASSVDPVTLSSSPAGFGFADWDGWASNADGTLDTQAGSHPYEFTLSFDLNAEDLDSQDDDQMIVSGGEIRDVEVGLPPGLVGDPTATPQCTREEFDEVECPEATQIGLATVDASGSIYEDPVYNLVPPAGEPSEFAFSIDSVKTLLDSTVRTGSDYGITTRIANVAEGRGVLRSVVTLWGVPAEESHLAFVGKSEGTLKRECAGLTPGYCPPSGQIPKPLLTLPTSCVGPQKFTIRANSWRHPETWAEANFLSHDSDGNPAGFTGCEHMQFAPKVTLAPDTSYADTPAGLTVDVKPPVGGLVEPGGLSTADIQNTKVVLPAGVVINPGQAAGLAACQSYQDAVGTEEAPSCPAASKVGTVKIKTPLLEGAAEKEFEGNVYVLQSNPPDLKLLVAASADGINLKIVGDVHLDESTGQLTSTFEGTPELPFTDFRLSFSGGAQAALATPVTCGVYTAEADFGPWASPFVADALNETAFTIENGPDGSACPPVPLPFSPAMTAGSTTDQAGGFTDFSLLLQAADDQQRIGSLRFKTPEGLLGMISKIPLCGEPQAADGTCSVASQIGHTVVAAGPGPYPLVVPQPGQPPASIYLTGPYKGAPYGLSIVVPLVVGPFTLQTQVVRAKIEVDPLTSQLTVTTDPLPQIIDGIPTDLRTINAVIDRPGFMFNPTSCAPMSFSGTATSAQGATAPLSSHFQMGSCQSLKFKPNFKVSTAGKTSRKDGASLDVKLVYPVIPLEANQASQQSNIQSVKVDLPKQLPSRLTTLQKACTSATFNSDPANCPTDSRVGEVTAITPVLPVALTGPAYFVSYGGAKFPELVFVLQGYGVTVDVHAETFISKAGITSSTLRHVPDVPITSFELKLPEGPFSALAANGNLCASTLKMPTAFTGQNGATIHQSTPITVTGCPKHKAKKALNAGGKGKKKK